MPSSAWFPNGVAIRFWSAAWDRESAALSSGMSAGPNEHDAAQWIASWRLAAVDLDRIRREEVQQADTAAAVLALAGAFRYAREHLPVRQTSGLVEQQRLFARLR